MTRRFGSATAVLVCLAVTCAARADDRWPQPVLQVVRLKPGESRALELALPAGEFRPWGKSGRDGLGVARFPRPGEKVEYVRPTEQGGYDLGDGLSVVWEKGRPGITVRAAKDAKPGTTDVRVTYTQFTVGSGEHLFGLRVVVEGK